MREAMHMRGQRVYKNSILLVQFLFSFTVNLKLFFLKKKKDEILIKKIVGGHLELRFHLIQ